MRKNFYLLLGIAAYAWSPTIVSATTNADSAAECTRLAAAAQEAGFTEPGVNFAEMDAEAAMQACSQAVKDDPVDARSLFHLGYAMVGQKRYDEALSVFEKAADAGSTSALVGSGVLYDVGLGVEQDHGKAAEFYRRASEAGDPWGSFKLGYLYANGYGVPEDHAEAERLFRAAILVGRSVTVHDAQNSLAWMFALDKRNLDEAEIFARAAVAGAGEDGGGSLRPLIFRDTLAWVLHAKGEDEAALAEQLKVMEQSSEKPVAQAHLGDIYAALGRDDEARAAWQKAIDLPVDEPSFDSSYDLDALRAKLAK